MERDRDHYDRIRGESRTSIKIQRSEFLGVAFPIESESGFHESLEAIRKELFDATHHCWAYRLLYQQKIVGRSSDAGEPSGTAGRPILQAIEDADLLETAVVVVRWYGGVKLGTGGLARAYRDAARDTLATAPRSRIYIYRRLECRPGFDRMNQIYRLIDPPDVVLVEERFDPNPLFVLDVRSSLATDLERDLLEQRIEISD